MESQIPEVVVSRLPRYLWALGRFKQDGVEFVSSNDLGASLRLRPEQVRKDLSYFGRFGRRGKGYSVDVLHSELGRILGVDRQWSMAVVGVGRLGAAIIDYKGFATRGFEVVAAFDKDRNVIGNRVGGLVVQDVAELKSVLKEKRVHIAIVAVPTSEAEAVIEELARCGVRYILDYAGVCGRVPAGVRWEGLDPVVALQSMSYYLARASEHESQGQGPV